MRIFYRYPQGRRRALTFSFDDGVVQDEKLIAIFNRYGLKGTFNINSGLAGLSNRIPLTAERFKEIYAGHEIACHGVDHGYFDQSPWSEVMREVWHDREVLEKLTGEVITGLAYPCGRYPKEAQNILRAAGIEYARTTNNFNNMRYLPEDFLAWHPTCHFRNAMPLVDEFLGSTRSQFSLFYIWGHSYEFDCGEENWDYMEELACKLSGHDDVWYATNIEICRYAKAIRELKFSADGSRVYNPTAQTIWFEVGGKMLTVSPGETCDINAKIGE